jgi:Rrf2 family nitric oxide-sensitive transcriptional repressor
MRLTAYTDYSLRVLMYVALHPDRRPTIAEIATRFGVSKNHLMKVVHQLGVSGYVETMRGQGGGLRLARAPDAVGIGELVRRTEPDLAIAPCLQAGDTSCVITPACILRRALHEARAAFLAVLDGYSLADLVANPDPLRLLLAERPRRALEAADA